MTLTDAGPLVALIDADEADHEVCALVLRGLGLPLVTTCPAFTEAMHLLSRAGGSQGTDALWKLLLSGRLEIATLSPQSLQRSAQLMVKYKDRPMNLAESTLVAVDEERGERKIFTVDNNFHTYRLHGRLRFVVVPGR